MIVLLRTVVASHYFLLAQSVLCCLGVLLHVVVASHYVLLAPSVLCWLRAYVDIAVMIRLVYEVFVFGSRRVPA